MGGQRLSGVLWLIAGISSGLIAFFVTDPLTLAVFVIGAVAGVIMGLAMLVRPATGLAGASTLLAVAWLAGFGAVMIGNLSAPIEELLSVVWVLAFGVAGGIAAFRKGRSPAFG